jgi:hypothetical protein
MAQWLRHCATNRKIAGSIPDGVTGFFHWYNPSGHTVALRSTQPLTCHLHVPIVLKSGSLNLLEPSGPVTACNGIALPNILLSLHKREWDGINENLKGNLYIVRQFLTKHQKFQSQYSVRVAFSSSWTLCIGPYTMRTCSHYIQTKSPPTPMPPHVPYGPRGLPSRLWPKYNRLLMLGRPWGAVTLSRWGGWWYMNMKYQEGP